MSGTYHFYRNQTVGCRMCGKCCGRYWPVPVSEEEAERLSKLELPEVGKTLARYFRGGYIAKKNRACVFSDGQGKCLIHSKYGLRKKALACRLYPLDIHRWEDGSVSASLRYDCPAVAHGEENNLAASIAEIDGMAEEIAVHRIDPAPAYSESIRPPLARLREIASAYAGIVNHSGAELSIRLLDAAHLLDFHTGKKASEDILEAEEFAEDAIALFERSIPRLSAMLEAAEKPGRDPAAGFRYLLASFLRNDNGKNVFARFGGMCSALKFTLGLGVLETADGLRIPPALPEETRFREDAFEPYLRWLNGRLESLHFCGGAAFGITFEEGMRCLLLSYPAVAAAAGVLAGKEGIVTRHETAEALVRLDYSFLRTRLYRDSRLKKAALLLTEPETYASLIRHIRRAP